MEEKINQEALTLESVQSFNQRFTVARDIPKRIRDAGILSIICSQKNGKRLMLSKRLMVELGEPETLQISFSDNEIAIYEDLSGDGDHFKVKNVGAKGAVYSAGLVHEMTKRFGLDFSDKVSATFYEVRYVDINEKKVAIITVTKEND